MRAFLLSLVLFHSYAMPLPVIYDPFVKAKKIIKQSKEPHLPMPKIQMKLSLSAIFNDKAYINGRFYRVGQKIAGYTVVGIKENYVILQKNHITKILPLQKKKVLRIKEP